LAKRRDPDWRERAAVELLTRHLPRLDLSDPVLVVEEYLRDLEAELKSLGRGVSTWFRRVFGGKRGAPWPTAGPFGAVLLRHPRGKDELAMDVHAAASVLKPGGSLVLYGTNDEGIRGGPAALNSLFEAVETVATGGRCRVIRGRLRATHPEIKGALSIWRQTVSLDHPELPDLWVTYPGVFARGRLDDGTRLLLGALPTLSSGARVLDYGCGSGIVGFVARERASGVEVELLDVDSVALEAAKENVPDARLHLHDGMLDEGAGPFDAILSNPPFHRGKAEVPELIITMIEAAPRLLAKRGILVFVAQKRLRVEASLKASFGKTEVLAEDSTFRVWEATEPTRHRTK
jgi:16S rRNA (guanine1207-N2)-methyltransferase